MAARGLVRIAAAGDVHCGPAQPRRDAARVREASKAAATSCCSRGDLTTHGASRAGGDRRRGGGADRRARCSRCSATTTTTTAASTRSSASSRTAGWRCSQRGFSVTDVRRRVGGDRRHEGLRRRLPGLVAAGLRRTAAARGLRRDRRARPRRSTAACRRSPTARFRVVLLHYAPVQSTLEGEPRGHPHVPRAPSASRRRSTATGPDLVLHGHAHAGRLRGTIGDVPVYNVSVPVMQRDFWLFELTGAVAEERARRDARHGVIGQVRHNGRGPVAQRSEQRTHNPSDEGSSPSRPMRKPR